MTDGRSTAKRESRSWLIRAALAALVPCLGVDLAAQPAGFGEVTFPSSGSPAAQPEFLRGVAALHSFEYEEAQLSFRRAQEIDAGFALAYWGEAMTYHQTLWRNEDVAAGRQALTRLAATPAGRTATAPTPRERGLMAAVEILFGTGDGATRRREYARAMEELHAKWPDDPEVATFHALALLGTLSRGLIGTSDVHGGHSEGLAGSETQTRVAAILQRVLKTHPRHPGALHYLLHTYDDPEHARLALDAARTYATVAPASSHALHMPAHVFLQLGLWHQAADADAASYRTSVEWANAKSLPTTMRNFHALGWRQYELLQLGRHREASDTISELVPIVRASRQLTLLSDLASMRARYVIETRRWDVLANERNFGNVNELFAIGVSAARTGNASQAERARAGLVERAQSEQEGDLRPAIAIMEREVAALIDLAAGRRDQAVTVLREAARAEQRLPPPLGPPKPIKPAPELLGEVLVEIGRPRESIEPLRQALQRNPNRSLAVLALARAFAALGEGDEARAHYKTLLANYDEADADLPEIQEARLAVGQSAGESQRSPSIPRSIAVVTGAIGLVGVVLWVRRFGGRQRKRVGRGRPTLAAKTMTQDRQKRSLRPER
jgi:tetratricopeptide (TPR) repeat protein